MGRVQGRREEEEEGEGEVSPLRTMTLQVQQQQQSISAADRAQRAEATARLLCRASRAVSSAGAASGEDFSGYSGNRSEKGKAMSILAVTAEV